jgi:[ribosomal protein S5]-alanine N-acetyltransferase
VIGASRRHIYEPYPTLRTERLLLREFSPEDAPDVRRLAGVRKLVRTTRPIPHPYPEGEAERWISTHRAAFEAGEVLHFAVQTREGGELVGGITLAITPGDARAHLTYWIGVPYWGKGYATEAAREAVSYAFEDLGLHRLYAAHFGSNPASGKVMRKIGMTHERTLRGTTRCGASTRAGWSRVCSPETGGLAVGGELLRAHQPRTRMNSVSFVGSCATRGPTQRRLLCPGCPRSSPPP